MNNACAIALNWNSLCAFESELIGDEQHDRLLEQAVIEGAEKLRSEQRQDRRARQVGNVLNQKPEARGVSWTGADGIASFAEAAKPL